MSEDKKVAYDTLFECLVTVSQLMSPIAPFFSDWLYKNLTDNIRVNAIAKNTPYRHDSVHLSILYQVDASKIDVQLEERMGMAQDICSMVLSLRKKEKIKVRQPLQKILIPVENETKNEQLRKVENYILSEVNVKEIEYVTDTAGIVTKKAKPNFKALGPKLGAMMKSAKAVFENLSQEQIIQLERDKKLTISIEDKQLEITTDEVEIISEDIPGWIVTNLNQLTVALDINLTPQLLAEGNAREFVNKVQNLRKDKDFNVTDRILVEINKVDKFADALNLYKDYICNEILAEQITVNDSLDQYDEIDVNETMIKVKLRKK
jgi:isoleucyl-tRNA synthetase